MEKSSSENDPETPFFCHLCSVSCLSALNLQGHFLGSKHRKAEEALRDHKTDEKEPIEKKPKATLQDQIDACKNSEPALGLEYIYHYRKGGHNRYDCKLCECQAGLAHMFMHIVGAKHRINYLSKHHPSLGISGTYIVRGPKRLKKLKAVCLTVEKEFGRQKINVLEGSESQWSFNTDLTAASSVFYKPDSELEQMDFTSDDFFDEDGKPEASEHVTFLELKAAHEANQKKARSSGGTTNTEKKDAEKKVKGTGSEHCESDQAFTSKKDLLDFLEHFRIFEDGDVKFVITVIEMLSIALLRHKRRSKQNEEKLSASKSDSTNEQGRCKKQNSVPSVSPHANQDPKSQSKEELPSVSKLGKTEALERTIPLTFSDSTPGIPQDPKCQSKEELPSVSKLGKIESLAKTISLTFSESTPGIPQDTAASCNETQKIPVSQLDNSKPTSESQPSSSLASAPQNPVYSAPQMNRRTPLVQTRFGFPHTQFPPRAAPPLFPIAKDDIVNKFFESIKNMEVAEVISTLNKITTTNPAFKGIHVPSLIRYLREMGKLKSAQSMQQLNQ